MLVCAVLLVGACTFSKEVSGESDDEAMPMPTDDEEEPGEDPAPMVAPCTTPDASGLVVCLEFEDSVADGVMDDSSPARRSVQTTGMAQVPRDGAMNGGSMMAADVGPQASTYVAQEAALDLASGYTLAAWVKPDTAPAAGTARGVMDHEGQYAMIVSANGGGMIQNRCQHAGVSRYEYTTELPVGAWTFLACTWDGTQLCASRWSSPTDHERYCHTPAMGPAASGARGLAVGHLSSDGVAHSRFDGALDSVQVYKRGMTENQLCALAGQGPDCMPCDACQ
jgi:hypothetical protein